MTALTVYWNGRTVGTLTQSPVGDAAFTYDATYVQGGQAISCALPLDAPVDPQVAAAWFGNLLPEGTIRESTCRSLRIDFADDFTLLEKLGRDCAGALAIVAEGEPAPDDTTVYEPMVPFELAQRIENNRASPLLGLPGERQRLSLAGAQSKLPMTLIDGAPYRTSRGPTTHILKPLQPQYPGLCFNEYFCAQLAAQIKLDVPASAMVAYQYFRDGPAEYAFAITRYDRAGQNGNIMRLHQEDFCQALGRPRGDKYTLELADLVAVLRRHARVPAMEIDKLLRGVLFNLIIGNRDAHAKNYSLLHEQGRVRLAPLYDLVCTLCYPGLNIELPQPLGDAKMFDDIGKETWSALASQIGVASRTVIGLARGLAMQLPAAARDVQQRLARLPGFEPEMAQTIVDVVDRHGGKVLSLLPPLKVRSGSAPGRKSTAPKKPG